MKKKWLVTILSLMMVFTLSACGTTEKTPGSMNVETPAQTPAETPAETPTEAVKEVDMDKLVTDYFKNMPAHSYKIDQAEFVKMVKDEAKMTVLDIRSAEDYAKGHVKGAVNMPWGTAISDGLSTIPADLPLFVYCYTGQTAGQAVLTLNLAGFDARSVNLGWNLGISKVDGIADVTVTEATALTGTTTAIEPAIQSALDEYYAGLATVSETKYKNYKISEDDLKAMVDAKDTSISILSVRKAEDFKAGHIEGATNIPFGKDMADSFSTLPKDKTIVVYCYTGQTAGQAVAGLRLMGFNAVSLNAGMGTTANAPAGWANKGFPVVQ